MPSTAISPNAIAASVGYLLAKGNFNTSNPNLPQRIAILGEATTAAQSGLSTAAYEITNAKMAGDAYGYASPIYAAARILFPLQGGGVTCPVIVYPQASSGATAKVRTVTVTGTATGTGTHYVMVAGRGSVDGGSYAINIATDDTPTIIAGKIKDAMNNCLACPMSATNVAGVVTATAEWTGLTSDGITISVNTNGNALGVSYAIASTVSGAGTPAVATSLALFGEEWNTIVINTYGTVTATMAELEVFNGIPSQTNPTGRFTPTAFKPFIALTGSVADDPSSITDARKLNQTIAICPAPLSAGLAYEAAANMAVLWSKSAGDAPNIGDPINQYYPDMPAPVIGSAAPAMNSLTTRESYVQKGCSTAVLVSGGYKVLDFVTTYHPDGETPPQYRYPRDLNIDFNAAYAYNILVYLYQFGKTIANDGDIVSAQNVIKPSGWTAIVQGMYEDFVKRGLFADKEFGLSNVLVNISTVNPNRMETEYKYKRTGITRQSANTAFAGFNFGTP